MRKFLLTAAALATGLTMVACGVQPVEETSGKAKPTVTAKKGPRTVWGDGTYKVGSEIKAGTYRTKGDRDKVGCYWERLKSADGELSSVISNDVPVGPATVTVKKTDKFVKFSGGCKWTAEKAKK